MFSAYLPDSLHEMNLKQMKPKVRNLFLAVTRDNFLERCLLFWPVKQP